VRIGFDDGIMATFEEIDRVFAPIADAVARFAQLQSFRLEKCQRGNAGWELTRPHTLGGTVTLLLLYDPSLGLGIGSVWQFPCQEMSLLYSHFHEMHPCPLSADEVAVMLEKEMQEITQVRFGNWTHISPLQAG
jgi:hypothetical protein